MHSTRFAIFGGVIIFVLAVTGTFLIGRVYSSTEARGLIEAMAPSLRTLCFAIITASATIISLLLTTVGFAHRLKDTFDRQFYRQVKLIAQLCSVLIIIAVSVLLILTIPLIEAETLRAWFSAAYYLLSFFSAILSGLIVTTVILLYQTMTNIISVVNFGLEE